MSIKKLVTWITFLAVFAMAARISMDTDTWWHLRTGQWILENGRIPATDPFSYTRFGEPWRIPGWLVQVPMTWMYRLGGPGLLNLWVAGMVTLSFGLIWKALDGGVFTRAFVVILGAAAAGVYWAARPYMMTFLLTAAFLRILEDWRHGRKDRLWWLPVLMVIWANSHGGFVVGIILWGVYVVGAVVRGDAAWRGGPAWRGDPAGRPYAGGVVGRGDPAGRPYALLIVGIVMIAAVALNPFGPEMLLYPFKTVGIESLRDFIQEWQSPNFHERQVWPFAAMIFLLFGALGASGRRISLEDFLLVTGWGLMGLWAGRNIATFALAGTIVLARHAAPVVGRWSEAAGVRLRPDRKPGRMQAVLNVVLLVIVILAVGIKAASVYPEQVNREAFAEFLPVDAVEYLKETMPEGRMFSSYNWGAYLLWELPEYPVFVDGRTDLYNDAVIGEWFRVVRAEEGWEDVLEKWEVDLVLVERGAPIIIQLNQTGWVQVRKDELAVLFQRRSNVEKND